MLEKEHWAPVATVIYGDNQGATALVRNPQFHSRTKLSRGAGQAQQPFAAKNRSDKGQLLTGGLG